MFSTKFHVLTAYNWNLFFHALLQLFEDCRLIQRILDAWEDNRVHETEAGGHRKGNMGHLTLITNQIIENMEKGANAERIRHFIEGLC